MHSMYRDGLQCTLNAGDGASGEVFAATWQDRQVAVKIFNAEVSPDGHSRDEIAIACGMSNPGG